MPCCPARSLAAAAALYLLVVRRTPGSSCVPGPVIFLNATCTPPTTKAFP